MNTSDLSDIYRNDIILANASQEGGEWMRLLAAWCMDLRSRNMETIDTKTIIRFIERFYAIHEKIHHRVVIILACTMDDPNSVKELNSINELNNQFLEEQKKLTTILQSLQSKTFLGTIRTSSNTKDYMQYVYRIIDGFELNLSVLPSGGLIFDPVDSRTHK